MSILFALFLYLISLAVHELGHILIHWLYFDEWAKVKISKFGNIRVIPEHNMNINKLKVFLGAPIIIGLLPYIVFITYFPFEGSAACIGYLVACGKDFYSLIKVEVNKQ